MVRTRDGATVLSLEGSGWDGGGIAPTFPAPDRVELHLRRYPHGSRIHDLVVDVEAQTAPPCAMIRPSRSWST